MLAGDFPQQDRAHQKPVTLKEELDRSNTDIQSLLAKIFLAAESQGFTKVTVNWVTS